MEFYIRQKYYFPWIQYNKGRISLHHHPIDKSTKENWKIHALMVCINLVWKLNLINLWINRWFAKPKCISCDINKRENSPENIGFLLPDLHRAHIKNMMTAMIRNKMNSIADRYRIYLDSWLIVHSLKCLFYLLLLEFDAELFFL